MMPDREKVIKGLECCIIDPNGLEDCKMNGCPYIKEAEETKEDESLYCQTCLFADALAMLKDQETVVRCKDCKHGEPWGALIGCGTSKGFGIAHNPDWFCADGERRVNDA